MLPQCRALADQLGRVEGVWAGETEEQRRLRRNRQRPRRAPQRVCVECGTGYDGPRYRYCSDACALYSRLAESTKQRMRQEART